jgi:hypothetical protein
MIDHGVAILFKITIFLETGVGHQAAAIFQS